MARRYRRPWRRQPGFGFAVAAQRLDVGTEIEYLDGAARLPHLVAQPIRRPAIDTAVIVEHHPITARAIAGDQTLLQFLGDKCGIAFERITPTAAAPGDEMQQI